jgi:hypothetical protein
MKPAPAKLSDQILAAHMILREQKRLTGCIAYLQRKLECSYNRAALVLGFLEDAHVLGTVNDHGERRWIIADCAQAVESLRGML